MVRAAAEQGTPVLGVCLGHQAIAEAFGAVVVRAPELLHGKTSEVLHEGAGVLAGLPTPFTATRYHSLAVDPATLPAELEVTGRTASGVVMALRHRELPIEGVQFHPESVLTEGGHRLLANWLAACGLAPDPAAVAAATAAAGGCRPPGLNGPHPHATTRAPTRRSGGGLRVVRSASAARVLASAVVARRSRSPASSAVGSGGDRRPRSAG